MMMKDKFKKKIEAVNKEHPIRNRGNRGKRRVELPGQNRKLSAYSRVVWSVWFPQGYEGECGLSASGAMVRCGAGKHTSANGIIYMGEWHEDRMCGRGTLKLPSGAQYEGEFKDNMYHGTGTYTFPDGSAYNGQFRENRLEGEGAFTNTQGRVWMGDFNGEAALGLKMQHI
ncbi:MORN repeat-containing protein 2 isoform X2 [Scophthalmus maximus]|uniref:MORN repeat-containing protein 2 isoform X2 n=1 Tax=Scophthalmus maximus TaxID=52904 RepID=UPI001FA8E0BC|nr:MORN repeat-containing protein 2 isoform X2 [Scophthalmus maximus]